jgi:hypothetical protein
LGRLSVVLENREPVTLELPTTSTTTVGTGEAQGISSLSKEVTTGQAGLLVGSKNSTKYHFPWCSGALRITEANKIYFNSIEEARAKGYSPATNCPGLQ